MFYQFFLSPQVKRCAIITYKHDIYEFPQELPNKKRFKILRNQEKSGKFRNFIELQPSVQASCQNENFVNTAIVVIIFWHPLIIQLTSESPKVKRCLLSSITNLVHELPHDLPNDLRLRILGNQEILEKCQMWVQTQPNAQSSFQKLNVDNSCQKTRKIRYYVFEVLPNFIVSLYFVANILSRIEDNIPFLF